MSPSGLSIPRSRGSCCHRRRSRPGRTLRDRVAAGGIAKRRQDFCFRDRLELLRLLVPASANQADLVEPAARSPAESHDKAARVAIDALGGPAIPALHGEAGFPTCRPTQRRAETDRQDRTSSMPGQKSRRMTSAKGTTIHAWNSPTGLFSKVYSMPASQPLCRLTSQAPARLVVTRLHYKPVSPPELQS